MGRGLSHFRRQSLADDHEAGKINGFQLYVFDSDESQRNPEQWIIGEFSPSGTTGTILHNAELFADSELIPCYRGDCSGACTAVKQDSWGRIRATFREMKGGTT